MITLITGVPGTGKTTAMVEMMLEAVEAGRPIYAFGIDGLRVPHEVLADAKRWHLDVPDGALIVIDEVQDVWRSQDRSKATEDLTKLEVHRHRGFDFILTTQGPHLVHPNVRPLVGRHIHLEANVFRRVWNEWSACSTSLRGAPVTRTYRPSKKAQALFDSASIHVKTKHSLPKQLFILVACLPLLAWLGHSVYSRVTGVITPVKSVDTAKALQVDAQAPAVAESPISVPPVAPQLVTASESHSEPDNLAQQAPRMIGCIRMRNRCECLGDDSKVLTVELKVCELNTSRGGAAIAYASTDYQRSPASSWYPAPQRTASVPAYASSIDHPAGQPPTPQITR